tara:strand:+ start:168 stop:665 length:498 start_codon:yes stop_codon:yes gene_type:complete
MADMKTFNPKGVLVSRKAKPLSLGGRRYNQGDAIEDDCISFRKRRQLYEQNVVCHPHELEALQDTQAANAAAALEDATQEEMEERADAEAEASREALRAEGKEVTETADPAVLDPEPVTEPTGEEPGEGEGDDEKSGEEGSEEPSKPVASKKPSKKKRVRKKKDS